MDKGLIKIGDSVSMQLGKYEANYVCISIFNQKSMTFRRANTVKTKIAAVRTPQIITILIK